MPLLHCNSCHHEWEGRPNSKCDWCGDSGHVLEEKTSFERFVEGDLKGFIERWKKSRDSAFGMNIKDAIQTIKKFKGKVKEE